MIEELTFERVKKRFDFYVHEYNTGGATGYNRRLKGACIGLLDAAAGGTDERHAIQVALTGEPSTKTMLEAHWYAIYKMVLPTKEENKPWTSGTDLDKIAKVILENVEVEHQLPLLGPEDSDQTDWDAVIEKVRSEG